MKTAGFPCRFGGCDARFFVTAQGSMPALLAASAERTAHETSIHEYTHIRLEEVVRKPAWTIRKSTPVKQP
ncbi:MAG TPA: hypothetical protein VM070_05705 [Candidatus Saccharimonadales bacterium]|nr:hypothetical protein [Candidatus Saccharimonadales bacterium]